MQAGHMNRDYPLHIHISTLFLIVIVIIGGLIGGVGYKLSSDTLTSAADDLARRISHETGNDLVNLIKPAEMATSLLRHDAITKPAPTKSAAAVSMSSPTHLPSRRPSSRSMSAIVRAISFSSVESRMTVIANVFPHRRPPHSSCRASSGTPGRSEDASSSSTPPSGRSARTSGRRMCTLRPAHTRLVSGGRRESRKLIRTAPYVFFTSQVIGTTLAMADEDGAAAIGADIRSKPSAESGAPEDHPGNPCPDRQPAGTDARA